MEPYHSKVSALDSSEQLQLEKSNENESEDGGEIPTFQRRSHTSLTFNPTTGLKLPTVISKSCSTRYEDEDFKGLEQRVCGKYKTFVELRGNSKLSVEIKSMLQLSDNPYPLLSQKENSFTSLTSIEGLHYRNPLEKDFEDEELTLEYKTLDYIGQGYHAVVKKIQHIMTNEIYAAKITRINDEEIALAIKNEFEILQNLDHPFILKPYKLIKSPSKSLMTMITEYVDCKNLTAFITTNNNTITENVAIKILKKLLIAVDYLHRNFVSHRDISPKNILVSDDLSLFKLVDFGVSKLFNTGKEIIDMITPTGVPAYRAPEIFKGQKFDEKVDEWNCGHVFYEMLMGKHISSKKLYKLIKEKELKLKIKHLSAEIQKIIEKLLELNPRKRITATECLSWEIFTGI